MTKEMIISSNGHETRVAILEEDQVTEIFIERERQRGVVGNVYKGRVSKVLPGMQSAFIDIGLERDGFLYVSDVIDTIEEFERLEAGDEDDEKNGDGAGAAVASDRGNAAAASGVPGAAAASGATSGVGAASMVGASTATSAKFSWYTAVTPSGSWTELT